MRMEEHQFVFYAMLLCIYFNTSHEKKGQTAAAAQDQVHVYFSVEYM